MNLKKAKKPLLTKLKGQHSTLALFVEQTPKYRTSNNPNSESMSNELSKHHILAQIELQTLYMIWRSSLIDG